MSQPTLEQVSRFLAILVTKAVDSEQFEIWLNRFESADQRLVSPFVSLSKITHRERGVGFFSNKELEKLVPERGLRAKVSPVLKNIHNAGITLEELAHQIRTDTMPRYRLCGPKVRKTITEILVLKGLL